MAPQQDAQPTAPAPVQKLNPKTLIVGLLVALIGGTGYAGVDAAGYSPDTKMLEALGIGGAILLIGYLHYVWLPLFRQKGATLDAVEKKVDKANATLDAILARLNVTLLVLVFALAACPGTGPGPVIGQAIVDCTGENRPKIDALLGELSPLVVTGSADWPAVYQRAKTAGVAIGGCVLAELVQSFLGGRSAPPEGEGWMAHETLERFRTQEAGGATFKTRFGNL